MLIFILVIAAIIWFALSIQFKSKSYSKRLNQVRTGDRIKVNISGFVVDAECLNNSPETKRMFIRKFLSSGKISDTVEGYDEYVFINFDALNPVIGNSIQSTKDDLNDLLKKALADEKYEEASVLRDAISKLKEI